MKINDNSDSNQVLTIDGGKLFGSNDIIVRIEDDSHEDTSNPKRIINNPPQKKKTRK